MSRFDPLRFVRAYVAVLGVGLVVDSLLFVLLSGLSGDLIQNGLHLVWGGALLAVTLILRESQSAAVWAALISGAFSVALGVLGLSVEQPLGMQIGPSEQVLYFGAGAVSLVFGAWALRSLSAAPVPSRSAARPALSRTAPAGARRARRRPGRGRGGQRRH